MSWFIQRLSIWKTRRITSRNDDAEFGLDLPSSQCLSNSDRELCVYGSIPDKARQQKEKSFSEASGQVYAGLHQVSALTAGLFLCFVFIRRLMICADTSVSLARGRFPSSLPGSVEEQIPTTCSAYKYPQCEAAMQWHLSKNVGSRCEAFERVKAEGDFFVFPYSESRRDTCDLSEPGCCGCAGQCSKCPPLLAECLSWQIDGSWQIAFKDGSWQNVFCDAHGHCEIMIPSRSLPVTWKIYEQTYILDGSDIIQPQWASVEDAQRLCHEEPQCAGFTYDDATTSAGVSLIYFKSMSSLSPAVGRGWKTYVQERPNLHGSAVAAVAGALTQVSSDPLGMFRLDLHKAAPQLFPAGSMEKLTVSSEELQVERIYPGASMQFGRGHRK